MSTDRRRDGTAQTIGAHLQRERLEQRAAQLERVLQRLRHRVRAPDACAVERTGLHRALADFADELAQVRQRLRDAPSPQHVDHSRTASGSPVSDPR